MKRIFTFLSIIFLTATLWAQSPEKMSYQAVIRNSSNALVRNTQVGMRISFLQSSASGTAVYVETQTPTTNANGLVSVEIGSGTVSSGDFTNIDWANGPFFIKTETDLAGGASYTITGVSQLMSVPYALYAKNSGSSIPGPQGIKGETGATGPQGLKGETGAPGAKGENGKSAYEVWIEAGNTGTEAEFLASLQGETGATGPMGPQGPAGNDGVDGAIGLMGPQGIQGETGVTGAKGDNGKSAYEVWIEAGNTGTNAEFLASLKGETGATGPTGPQGPQGPAGNNGLDGATGPIGPMGPMGPAGGGSAQYAYIYNQSDQVVAPEADIDFSKNGIIKNEVVFHAPGASEIIMNTSGDYMIWFNVTGMEANQFTLYQNNTPVEGSCYGSSAGTQINSGMVILNAVAGDAITLRNHSSMAAVTLQTHAGGTGTNTNASILIQKIGD